MGLGTAFRAFTATLFNAERAARVDAALRGDAVAPATGRLEVATDRPAPKPAAAPRPEVTRTSAPTRSDAVTLLSTLQREARLLDLVFEDLSRYGDAQVGAAARPCLDQCRQTLRRVLDIRPLVDSPDGSTVDVPADASPLRFQRIGESSGATGTLVHHGWVAAKVQLPQWSGVDADATLIAPAQVK